jgi:2-C-methyl-D-erythritol 4-phosphate cytidylyltransferase/2-C-methyl-D-erythritol 2,4-cyclodiphosphate synthase
LSSLDNEELSDQTTIMKWAAIVVAAGTGSRAGAGLPKQWRILGGKTVASWSIEAFHAAGANEIVIVVAADEIDRARDYLPKIDGLTLVIGGATRAESVQAGLTALESDAPEAVLIHDAARPFLTRRHIDGLIEALDGVQGALLALPVADTLKRQSRDGPVATVDRDGLWRAQTPQAFRYAALRQGYAAWTGQADPTDDAAAIEAAGGTMRLSPGDPMLFKLTYAEDFAMAQALAGAARITRTGQGIDAHRFGPGDGVWLCGVQIAHDHGLIGHSDADVGLHAITDAILGAIGAGDIGDHFPPTDPQWKGAPSHLFLTHAVELVRRGGGELVHVDVTLVCERPKIKPHREAMRARLAELLGLPLDRISVKATTTEGMGYTGREEGLLAQAVATVQTPA